jgi:hypothetical protein
MSDEESPTTTETLESAMLAYLRENYDGVALVTGWVLIAEIMDADASPDLVGFAAENMPYWKINGLLDSGRDVIEYDDTYADADVEDEE